VSFTLNKKIVEKGLKIFFPVFSEFPTAETPWFGCCAMHHRPPWLVVANHQVA
jgi:hypothetical protein